MGELQVADAVSVVFGAAGGWFDRNWRIDPCADAAASVIAPQPAKEIGSSCHVKERVIEEREVTHLLKRLANIPRALLQSQLAGILGVAQAAAAVPPKAKFPFEANIQIVRKKDQGMDQIRSQHFDALGLRGQQPETMGKLERQKQCGNPCAARGHVHRAAFKDHL